LALATTGRPGKTLRIVWFVSSPDAYLTQKNRFPASGFSAARAMNQPTSTFICTTHMRGLS
ncbi:MAG: hypothetical protein WB707_22525, partial [Candidatus Acidiferrales bacterium]